MQNHHPRAGITILALLILSLTAAVQAAEIEITRMHPGEPAVLAPNEVFYTGIAYRSEQPLRIWVRPYYQGQQVPAMSNASPVYPAGHGEALGWFSSRESLQVDEIRISAHDPIHGEQATLNQPVSLRWDDTLPAHTGTPPSWVNSLQTEQTRLVREHQTRLAERDSTIGWRLFSLVITTSPVLYLFLQVIAWVRLRQDYPFAVKLPIYFMAIVLAISLFALLAGSNLWGIWLVFASPFAVLYLIIILLLLKPNND